MSPLEAPPAVYEAKRDLWLVLTIWGANVLLLAVAAWAWQVGEPLAFRVITVLVLAATTFFTLWVLYGTRYLLTNESLVAFCGPFRMVVPLTTIEEVRPSRNPLASAATSLDRLEIRRSGKLLGLFVSPLDKEGFLADLKLRCPQLVGRFDRLVLRR